MKIRNLSFAFVLFLALFAGARSAEAARIPVFYSTDYEKIVKVAEFPDDSNFQTTDGLYFDAGYLIKQVQLFWIPLWNYGGEWCGRTADGEGVIRMSREELVELGESANVKIPESASLGFWNAIGGKLLALVLLAVAAVVGLVAAKS
ncbi:MAG: hypothetical protein H6686_10135 [Fibrobacteria bacterium]|nr:hypothetical protein [Fibrobacteria bacterium]